MKLIVKQDVEIEVHSILLDLPIRYDDEDIPFDFPCRIKSEDENEWDRLKLLVNIATGEILTPEFPRDFSYNIDTMKVCAEGVYVLYDKEGNELARHECYVPECVPGEFGDYVHLFIKDGFITNWQEPKHLQEFKI